MATKSAVTGQGYRIARARIEGFHKREKIMRISSSVPRSLLLAGAFIGVLSYGAAAQTASPRSAPAAAHRTSAGFADDRPTRQ